MLAQNFMTAASLSLPNDEHGALIKVLGMLERGELVHTGKGSSVSGRWGPSIPNGFNMGCSGEQSHCGTIACIGGWVAKTLGHDMNNYVNTINPTTHPLGLFQLYWGNTGYDVSTNKAASALRNYLTLGEPRWDEVMGD